MVIALKQEKTEQEKTEWINSHLPVFLLIFVGIILLSFTLRIVRKLLWVLRLKRRQKHFEECAEIYNECAIVDKRFEFKTAEDRLIHLTA